jgi:anti-anti-sigma factor
MTEKHGSHWLEREDRGDVTVVRVKLPTLRDDGETHDLFKQIYLVIDGMKRHKVVLSLAAVEYMASMALGKLVMLNRKTQSAGGGLVLCQLTPTAREILELTHLTDLLTITDDEEQAVAALA